MVSSQHFLLLQVQADTFNALYTAAYHQTSPTSNLNYKVKLDFSADQPLQVEQSILKKLCENKKNSKKFNFVKIKKYIRPLGFCVQRNFFYLVDISNHI